MALDDLDDIERDEHDEPQYETHGTLAEMTAERDSWRRVAERLEQEKRDACDQLEEAVSAMREATTLLEEVGTDDFVNPPTAEAMQNAAAELRTLTRGR